MKTVLRLIVFKTVAAWKRWIRRWLKKCRLTRHFHRAAPVISAKGAPAEPPPATASQPGTLESASSSKLRLLAPALRCALADAARRVQRRQREIERERLLEELGRVLTEAGTLAELVSLCAPPEPRSTDKDHRHVWERFRQRHPEALLLPPIGAP